MSLRDGGCVWAGALEAGGATLPPIKGDERDLVARLAAEGPPAEEVGLTPYGTPAFDARLEDSVDATGVSAGSTTGSWR
jgi:nitrate reductase delta subunit